MGRWGTPASISPAPIPASARPWPARAAARVAPARAARGRDEAARQRLRTHAGRLAQRGRAGVAGGERSAPGVRRRQSVRAAFAAGAGTGGARCRRRHRAGHDPRRLCTVAARRPTPSWSKASAAGPRRCRPRSTRPTWCVRWTCRWCWWSACAWAASTMRYLTARAIAADGCRLVGWIGNGIDPDMARRDDNLAHAAGADPAPCWGGLPHAAAGRSAAPGAFADDPGVGGARETDFRHGCAPKRMLDWAV